MLTTTNVIVPGPWFLEAARLLKDNPGLDVGVHLAITSEWENVKWRPLTYAKSLVDADGYFFPTVAPRPGFPPNRSIKEAAWKLDEIETELRAQLDAAKVFPHRIVTQVVPLKAFYPAETYHQNYATLHPNNPYIAFNDAPKVEHLRQEFPDLYTGK